MVQLASFVVAAVALSGFAVAQQPVEKRTFDVCIPRKVYEAQLAVSGHGKRTFGKHPKICEDDDAIDCKYEDMVWHHDKRTFVHKVHKKPCKDLKPTEPCDDQPTTTSTQAQPTTTEPCDDDATTTTHHGHGGKPTTSPHTDRGHHTYKPHKPSTTKGHTKPTDEPCDDDVTSTKHHGHGDKPTTTKKHHEPQPTEPCDDDETTTKKGHGHHSSSTPHGHGKPTTTKHHHEPQPTEPCDDETTTTKATPTTTPCDTTTTKATPTTTPCDETTTKATPTPTCDCTGKYEHVFSNLKVQIPILSPLLKKYGASCFDKGAFIGSSYASGVEQCLSLCDAKKGCTFVNTYKSGFLLKREAEQRRTLFSDPSKAYTCDFYSKCYDRKGGILGIDIGPIHLRDVSPAVEVVEARAEVEKRTLFVESDGFCKSGKC